MREEGEGNRAQQAEDRKNKRVYEEMEKIQAKRAKEEQDRQRKRKVYLHQAFPLSV